HSPADSRPLHLHPTFTATVHKGSCNAWTEQNCLNLVAWLCSTVSLPQTSYSGAINISFCILCLPALDVFCKNVFQVFWGTCSNNEGLFLKIIY
uniref:Uncharacterized protein n=1 Tax=Haplochromis burtoni TaxID=8153 RepID=A0A3Q2X3X6_HAPBU